MKPKKQMIIDLIKAGFDLELILSTCYLTLKEFLDYAMELPNNIVEIVEIDFNNFVSATCCDNISVYIIKLNENTSQPFVFDGSSHRLIKHHNIREEMKNCERYYISIARDNKINEILE